MRLVRISAQAFGTGKDGVGEVVVLVDEEIHILSGTFTSLTEEVQLLHGSVRLAQSFQSVLRKEVGVYLAEVLESNAAMRIQPSAVVVQLAADAGEVEMEHQIAVAARRGMLPDLQVTEKGFELVTGAHVVVLSQQVQREALAEAARTDEEEEAVRLLYHGDEAGLVHIIIIVLADIREVHHAVGKSLSAGYYVFQWVHLLSSCCFFYSISHFWHQRHKDSKSSCREAHCC